jgi:hypothetical protein
MAIDNKKLTVKVIKKVSGIVITHLKIWYNQFLVTLSLASMVTIRKYITIFSIIDTTLFE